MVKCKNIIRQGTGRGGRRGRETEIDREKHKGERSKIASENL